MFARRLNELRVRLNIVPAGPLLIKEGRHLSDPQIGQALVREFYDFEKRQLPRVFNRDAQRYPRQPRRRDGNGIGSYDSADECFDMAFVWSQTATGAGFYLPGSSLRGVLRSAAERTVARWSPDWSVAGDPFRAPVQRWVDDQRKTGLSPDSAAVYRLAGPIERCFGYTALRGRWTLADAWMRPSAEAEVVVRDSVGIDRRRGAAMSGIKFQFEAIVGGIFETTLTLINFELWQLGLLAHVLAGLDGGLVRMGYGTRRGLGRVRVGVERLEWRWYMPQTSRQNGLVRLPPLAELAAQAGIDPDRYGVRDRTIDLQLPLEPVESVIGQAWQLKPDRSNADDPWEASPWPQLGPLLAAGIAGWDVPPELSSLLGREEAGS